MSLLVPDVGEVAALQKWLNQNLTLKLYSNNKIPAEADTAASYTEVTGGGYSSKTLTFGTWIIGSDGIATYIAQDFTFTGTTVAPGTVYGYFIVDGSNVLLWAERFPASVLPFSPNVGSLIRITPRIQAT
jgi:hypothetical protein